MKRSETLPQNLVESDPSTLSGRDKVLRTALILFNKHGVHTTGIDRIIAESKVAKMTFYNNFASKDALIRAYYCEVEKERFANLARHTTGKTADPRKQILGIFDYLEEWFNSPEFNGCAFARGLSDFSDEKDSENYACIQGHYARWSNFVGERVAQLLKPAKAKVAVPQILTLILGSVAFRLAGAEPTIAQANKKLVEKILED